MGATQNSRPGSTTRRHVLASCLVMPAAALLGGCDVLDLAKNPVIGFDLPTQKFLVSTTDPRWKTPPTPFSQKLDCAAPTDCCMPPGTPAGTSTFDCGAFPLACDSGTCALSFLLEYPRAVNLAKDAPALAGQNGKVISQVTLTGLKYTISNQLGVTLPPVSVYIAPATVMTGLNTPQATLLATLPMTVAGATVMDTIPLTAEAQQAFAMYARDTQTPFNLIGSTTMVVDSGAAAPQGTVEITVTGTASAKF